METAKSNKSFIHIILSRCFFHACVKEILFARRLSIFIPKWRQNIAYNKICLHFHYRIQEGIMNLISADKRPDCITQNSHHIRKGAFIPIYVSVPFRKHFNHEEHWSVRADQSSAAFTPNYIFTVHTVTANVNKRECCFLRETTQITDR